MYILPESKQNDGSNWSRFWAWYIEHAGKALVDARNIEGRANADQLATLRARVEVLKLAIETAKGQEFSEENDQALKAALDPVWDAINAIKGWRKITLYAPKGMSEAALIKALAAGDFPSGTRIEAQ